LRAKAETRQLAEGIKEHMEKKPVMPDLCKHIIEFDFIKDRILCDLKKREVKPNECASCKEREPINV